MKELVTNIILCHIADRFTPSPLGRPNCEPAIVLEYVLLVLRSGMAWRHLQQTRCPYDYRTVYSFFRRWSRQRIFASAYQALYKLYTRRYRPKYHCIDSTYIKSIYGRDCVGRNPTDRGRRATKLSAIVDDRGIPISLFFCPGNTSDFKTVIPSCDRILLPKTRTPMYADKGYDSKAVRQQLRAYDYIDRVSKRGVWTHRVVNRRRGIVERFFSWLDKCRRLILRYDTLIDSYEAWTWLACCRIVSAVL